MGSVVGRQAAAYRVEEIHVPARLPCKCGAPEAQIFAGPGDGSKSAVVECMQCGRKIEQFLPNDGSLPDWVLVDELSPNENRKRVVKYVLTTLVEEWNT